MALHRLMKEAEFASEVKQLQDYLAVNSRSDMDSPEKHHVILSTHENFQQPDYNPLKVTGQTKRNLRTGISSTSFKLSQKPQLRCKKKLIDPFALLDRLPEESWQFELKELRNREKMSRRSLVKLLNNIQSHLSRYLVAFLNAKGGMLVIGVSDDRETCSGVYLSTDEKDEIRNEFGIITSSVRPNILPDYYQLEFYELRREERILWTKPLRSTNSHNSKKNINHGIRKNIKREYKVEEKTGMEQHLKDKVIKEDEEDEEKEEENDEEEEEEEEEDDDDNDDNDDDEADDEADDDELEAVEAVEAVEDVHDVDDTETAVEGKENEVKLDEVKVDDVKEDRKEQEQQEVVATRRVKGGENHNRRNPDNEIITHIERQPYLIVLSVLYHRNSLLCAQQPLKPVYQSQTHGDGLIKRNMSTDGSSPDFQANTGSWFQYNGNVYCRWETTVKTTNYLSQLQLQSDTHALLRTLMEETEAKTRSYTQHLQTLLSNDNSAASHHDKQDTTNMDDLIQDNKSIEQLFPDSVHRVRAAARQLPVWKEVDAILAAVRSCRVTILSGKTGCGKSTQVPRMLLEEAARHGASLPYIYISQQRRLASVMLAKRVAAECACELGELVGYHIGGRPTKGDDTRICYLTSGVLKNLLSSWLSSLMALQAGSTVDELKNYICSLQLDVLIFDEIHERDIDTDMCIFLLGKFLSYKPGLRIIIMSATMPSASFLQGLLNFTPHFAAGDVPVIDQPLYNCFIVQQPGTPSVRTLNIPGRTHTLTRIYIDHSLVAPLIPDKEDEYDSYPVRPVKPGESIRIHDSILGGIVNLILALLNRTLNLQQFQILTCRGVLVFLPGIASMFDILERLQQVMSLEHYSKAHICLLHSSLSESEHKAAINPAPSHKLKVVLSTTIAESSVTVPDIDVVIDSCIQRDLWFSPIGNTNVLKETWAPQSTLQQRAGRAGRTRPGLAIHMIPEQCLQRLLAHSLPAAQKVSVSELVLSALTLRGFPLSEVLDGMPDPPPKSHILHALQSLQQNHYIEQDSRCTIQNLLGTQNLLLRDSWKLTDLGYMLAQLPISPRTGEFIMYALALGVGDIAIVMAAIIDRKLPIKLPISKPYAGYKALLRFALQTRSDVIAGYNAYVYWLRNRDVVRSRDVDNAALLELEWIEEVTLTEQHR